MNFQKLQQFLTEKKQANFRYKQCLQAIFNPKVKGWNDVTVLAKDLRAELEHEVVFSEILSADLREAQDGSAKVLLDFSGDKVESVLMPANENKKYVVCLSSQVGCAMNCSFCATGALGFKRNLTAGEFAEQFLFWWRWVAENHPEISLSGAVVMGMGEPFANYENVADGLKFIIDGSEINPKHFSISTVGISEGIEKMSHDERLAGVNLAISLHSSDQAVREKIIPTAKTTKLAEIMYAIREFNKITGKKIFVEYLMLKNVNDSDEMAKKLVDLLRDPRKFHINLILYNPARGGYERSGFAQVENFRKILRERGFDCTRRRSWGEEIHGACGQLAGSV